MADKTAQEMILALNERGIPCNYIAGLIEYNWSSLCKVARGDQMDVPYRIGKRLEKLQSMKKVNPYKVGGVK